MLEWTIISGILIANFKGWKSFIVLEDIFIGFDTSNKSVSLTNSLSYATAAVINFKVDPSSYIPLEALLKSFISDVSL